jgi:hypothetical protein
MVFCDKSQITKVFKIPEEHQKADEDWGIKQARQVLIQGSKNNMFLASNNRGHSICRGMIREQIGENQVSIHT